MNPDSDHGANPPKRGTDVETRIVESSHLGNVEDVRRFFGRLDERSDLVEVRADAWRDSLDVLCDLIAGAPRPAIATVRSREQGGAFAGSEAERKQWLQQLSRVARFVDVDADSDGDVQLAPPARRIVSFHDFTGTPRDLRDILARMRTRFPDAAHFKVATTFRDCSDALTLLNLRDGFDRPLAAMAMGAGGAFLRALAQKLGWSLVYAAASGRVPTAPGQYTVAELIERFRLREQSASTRTLAVVGRPIGHSLSPLLHNHGLKALGLDLVYVALEPVRFEEVFQLAPLLDLCGMSVTLPFKEDAARWVEESGGASDAPTLRCGAANTLIRVGTGWSAFNTDVAGVSGALRGALAHLDKPRPRALIVGTGGAARGAVVALVGLGMEVLVRSRTPERAERLAAEFGVQADCRTPPAEFDLLVNATPLGMFPHPESCAFTEDELRKGQIVFDMVYRPRRTTLLIRALRHGAIPVEGMEMFLEQAQTQFQRFTGQAAPAAQWRELLERELQ